MAADITSPLSTWSTTAGSNSPAGSTAISTNLDDNLRQIQSVVRYLAASSTIASATTTDLSTIPETFVTVSGTTTITALGTVSAGIYKWLVFSGALTFTHNGTSLILPTSANLTTAAGDTALVLSLGSGNWRCLSYNRVSGEPVGISVRLNTLGAAAAANTISNGDYAQIWRWALTTASKSAFTFTESAASTNGAGDQVLVDIATVAASTAIPLRVRWRTNDAIIVNEDGEIVIGDVDSGGPSVVTVTGHGGASSANGGRLNLYGGDAAGTGEGGNIAIEAGNTATGTATGAININAGTKTGSGTRVAGGAISIASGAAGGSTSSADGGTVIVQSGLGGGTSGNGGDILVRLGEAGGASGTDGDFEVRVGDTQAVFIVNGSEEHLYVNGAAAPTVNTGGGSGVAIAGKDNAFRVTMGTGSPTSVTVDFGTAWATAPVAVASTSKSGQTIYISSCTTTQIVVQASAAWAQNDILHVICMGYQ